MEVDMEVMGKVVEETVVLGVEDEVVLNPVVLPE